jgi:hypothetical protein
VQCETTTWSPIDVVPFTVMGYFVDLAATLVFDFSALVVDTFCTISIVVTRFDDDDDDDDDDNADDLVVMPPRRERPTFEVINGLTSGGKIRSLSSGSNCDDDKFTMKVTEENNANELLFDTSKVNVSKFSKDRLFTTVSRSAILEFDLSYDDGAPPMTFMKFLH